MISVLQSCMVIHLGTWKLEKMGQKRWIWGGRAGWADSFPVLRSRDKSPRQIQFWALNSHILASFANIIVFLIFKVDLQRLKAALELSVQDILVEVGAETGCNFTAESSATISELVLEKSLRSAGDLQAFATHAKRQSVTAEDVKLLTRRNPELVSLFSQLWLYLKAWIRPKV